MSGYLYGYAIAHGHCPSVIDRLSNEERLCWLALAELNEEQEEAILYRSMKRALVEICNELRGRGGS